MLDGTQGIVQNLIHHIQTVLLELMFFQLFLQFGILTLQFPGLFHPGEGFLIEFIHGLAERASLGNKCYKFLTQCFELCQLTFWRLGLRGWMRVECGQMVLIVCDGFRGNSAEIFCEGLMSLKKNLARQFHMLAVPQAIPQEQVIKEE